MTLGFRGLGIQGLGVLGVRVDELRASFCKALLAASFRLLRPDRSEAALQAAVE